jgi:hypothetical protein
VPTQTDDPEDFPAEDHQGRQPRRSAFGIAPGTYRRRERLDRHHPRRGTAILGKSERGWRGRRHTVTLRQMMALNAGEDSPKPGECGRSVRFCARVEPRTGGHSYAS